MPATLDETTRILDWEPWLGVASLLVPQTRRRQGSLSLLMLALDGVPAGREREAGDVLVDVLRQAVRQGDVVGRQGQNSFAILAVDTPQAGALHLAHRIHAILQVHRLTASSQPATVSIGVATCPESAVTAEDLLRQAEVACSEAVAGGGDRVRLAGWEGPEGWLLWEVERDRLAARRRASRLRLTRAVQRGWIQTIRIQTQPNACTVCLNAARDPATPDFLPDLPIVGCSTDGGCRCSYASPALQRRPPVPSVDVDDAAALNIPRKLRGAAFLGGDPRQHSSSTDLADYLERFPLLRFQTSLDLPDDEAVYLQRPAQRAWEHPGALGATLHGALVPVELPFRPWVERVGRPASFSAKALQGARKGTLYVTNRRILFDDGATIDSIALVQIEQLELFSDAISCRAERWQGRLVFLLKDPLPASLYVARALRAELLLC